MGTLASWSLPDHSLDDPVHMRYASTNAFWFHSGNTDIFDQHEVELFARDPVEHFRALYALPGPNSINDSGFDASWTAHTTNIPAEVPFVPYLVYPGAPNILTAKPAGPVPVSLELSPSMFFDGVQNPVPTRTVKAVRIVRRGICSKFWSYTDLLAKIDDRVFRDLAEFNRERLPQGPFNCGMEREFSNLASFINMTTEREDAQLGGFFLNTNVGSDNSLTFLHDAYWFRLIDGRLSVEPQRILVVGTDDGHRLIQEDFFAQTIESAPLPISPPLPAMTVAESVWNVADQAQVFTTNKPCVPAYPLWTEVPASDPPAQACGGFVKDILDGAVNAAMSLSMSALGFSAADIDELRATVLETTPGRLVNGPVYRNFRCVERLVGNNITPICEFVLRAKRVNVFPNGISLVFIDEPRELGNPVYPLWLQLIANGAQGALCDGPEQQPAGQLAPRTYVNVKGACTDYVCASCPCNAPLVPQPCK